MVDHAATGGGLTCVSYMYAYTFYLFFDFAGYSAFAIAISYLLGIRTPENFNLPFLAPNIRDFWNRWHISLSFWFRDHIYMRFLLAAAKGKWFKNKHTASYIGLFLTFGIMGVWHGTEWYYILYGIYHASLLCGYDSFARWNKTRNWFSGGRQVEDREYPAHLPRGRIRPAALFRPARLPSAAPARGDGGEAHLRRNHRLRLGSEQTE